MYNAGIAILPVTPPDWGGLLDVADRDDVGGVGNLRPVPGRDRRTEGGGFGESTAESENRQHKGLV